MGVSLGVAEELVFPGELENLDVSLVDVPVGDLQLLPQLLVAFEQFPHHVDALDQSLGNVVIVHRVYFLVQLLLEHRHRQLPLLRLLLFL